MTPSGIESTSLLLAHGIGELIAESEQLTVIRWCNSTHPSTILISLSMPTLCMLIATSCNGLLTSWENI